MPRLPGPPRGTNRSTATPHPAVVATLAALAVLALLVAGPASSGLAAGRPTPTPTSTEDATAVQQVRDQLAESSQEMLKAATDLSLADRALPGAKATAAHARRLLAGARAREARASQARGEAQVRYVQTSQSAEQSSNDVTAAHARIGRLARAVYQGGGSLGSLSMLLEARSPTDFADRLVSLQTIVSSQRSELDQLELVQRSADARATDLQQVRDDVAAVDERAQAAVREVTQLAEQARSAEAQVAALVKTRQDALAAAAAAQVADDAAHAQIVTTTSQLQTQLAAESRRLLGTAGDVDGATVPPRPGTLSWPVNGPVTSPFGMRVHPVTGVYKLHTGTDLGVPCGTEIHVALPGVVTEAGYDSAYGWRTIVSHGVVDGVLLTTTYNHQSHESVSVGDQLSAGQVIGLSGTTGYSTGCHLHFELYVNAALVDPEPWLPVH